MQIALIAFLVIIVLVVLAVFIDVGNSSKEKLIYEDKNGEVQVVTKPEEIERINKEIAERLTMEKKAAENLYIEQVKTAPCIFRFRGKSGTVRTMLRIGHEHNRVCLGLQVYGTDLFEYGKFIKGEHGLAFSTQGDLYEGLTLYYSNHWLSSEISFPFYLLAEYRYNSSNDKEKPVRHALFKITSDDDLQALSFYDEKRNFFIKYTGIYNQAEVDNNVFGEKVATIAYNEHGEILIRDFTHHGWKNIEYDLKGVSRGSTPVYDFELRENRDNKISIINNHNPFKDKSTTTLRVTMISGDKLTLEYDNKYFAFLAYRSLREKGRDYVYYPTRMTIATSSIATIEFLNKI